MIRILLAEDNSALRQLMTIHLKRAGYEVFTACDGLQALDILQHNSVQLMIVDMMMPRMDGCQLVESLREANINTPVLMVTVRDSLDDKRLGFRAGADDYLVKPVEMEELLLHVEALLRRSGMNSQKQMRLGSTLLDEERLTVSWPEHRVILRQKEFLLLHLLLSYQGRIFTRQVLMDDIWGYDSETDPRSVDVHIKRLREKLAENEDFTIETVRGLGYKAVIK